MLVIHRRHTHSWCNPQNPASEIYIVEYSTDDREFAAYATAISDIRRAHQCRGEGEIIERCEKSNPNLNGSSCA